MNERLEEMGTSEKSEINLIINLFNQNLAKNFDKLLSDSDNDKTNTLNREELEAYAAMQSLPKDPTERLLFLDEAKKRADGRFSDSALTALEALSIHSDEIKSKLKISWRNCLTYPQHLDKWTANKLDEIAKLIDILPIEDRYTRISTFLETAKNNGLISEMDYKNIRTAIAEQL